ncbi:signal peptidase I [Candidatus Kaiserbacteria bacterium]|nr:signal peptidase I [Candidatus Kaiserbacteria bacterium]USN92175.1 MAG: signal peptidase I [Candidatus Nomurabacteria bacterium]
MKLLFKIGYYTLALVVLGFGALLLLMQTAILPGYEVRIVQSGSMEPAIPIGSLVVVKKFERYEVGDVITFGGDFASSLPTTHRIISDSISEGKLSYETKGDANATPDEKLVDVDSVRGKVILSLPFLGYLLDFARQPLGFALLIGIPAGFIAFEEIGNIVAEVRNRKKIFSESESI